ncbi:MAG TPA: cation transporter, partial [Cyanobacteria bacterium UBA11367]|nr:cation transporter [Cyanobacteria bacterium UBA11367]
MTIFSISAIAIRRHIGTLILTLTVIVLGVFFLPQIQVDLLPSITYPRIGVRLAAPGVSPEVAVEEITKPLEKALTATEGVVQVFSQTREGQVSLDLFFQPGGDIEQALNDATASFNRAQSNLPDIIEQPRLFKFDPSQSPVYELALNSSALTDRELRIFADEELSRELSVIPGVAGVDVAGGVTEEVGIKIDPNRLQALGIGLKDILDSLKNRNQDVSGGRLRGGEVEPLTRTVGKFRDVEEIRNLSFEIPGIGSGENVSPTLVYLRDFAEVIDGTEEQRVFVYLNGEPAVKVSIQKQPDANTIQVVDGVKKRITQLRESGLIPADMELVTTLDESVFIRNSIANVASSGLIGAVLAAVAVFLFLGSLRQTLIIVLAIPLATLAAVILMQLFGLSLNVFSLGGLALGVGIVVDNAIVMLENIAVGFSGRRKEEKKISVEKDRDMVNRNGDINGNLDNFVLPTYPTISPILQAEISSREVESALVASTTTNLVAVLPFLLIGGFFSLLFNELILTISFAVAASLLVAVTLVPMLSSRLLAISWSSRIGKFWLLRGFNQWFEAVTRSYGRTLKLVVKYRILVIAIAFLILGGGSWFLVDQIPQEILPRINTGQATIRAQFPPGTTLETNRKVMGIVDKVILNQPETEYAFTTAGGFLFG